MVTIYAVSLAAIAVTAICLAIITTIYWKSPGGPLTFKRRVILTDYTLLLIYLCSYFIRNYSDETEILCVPSMLSLYLLWECFLITCTTFSNGKIHKNLYALLFYNLLPITLLVPQFIYAGNGQISHFLNYSHLISILGQPMPLQAYMRIAFAIGIVFCKVMMIIEIVRQQLKYKQQIIDENGNLKGVTQRNHIYIAWALLLTTMSIGQIIPSPAYHIVLKLGIISAVISITLFYLKLHKRLMILQSTSKDKGNSIKEKIDLWLNQDPFPLSETDLTMEKTARLIGVPTVALSYYIYEFAGKTFLSWQSECRMLHCRELLKDDKKNISEIAYECGYSDLAAMSKAFKRRFGVAPTVYRKTLTDSNKSQ